MSIFSLNAKETSGCTVAPASVVILCGVLAQVWDITIVNPIESVTILGQQANRNPARGHIADVISLAIMADGSIASGGRDERVIIWEPPEVSGSSSFVLARTLVDPGSKGATSMAVLPHFQSLTPAGGVLAVGYADKKVRVWQPLTGALLAVLSAHSEPIFSMTVLKDLSLAVASADGTVSIWDTVDVAVMSPMAVLTYGQSVDSTVSCLSVATNGALIAGSLDKTVGVWRFGYTQPSNGMS